MRVAGNLEADAGGFGDGNVVGSVGQQDAGAVAVDADFVEDRAEVLCVGRVFVGHANDLQAVNFGFLVVEDTHATGANGVDVLGRVAKLFVIPFHEKCAELGLELVERRCGVFGVYGGAVVHVAGDPDDVGFEAIDARVMRRAKPMFFTWPRCMSLTRAALRPRQEGGRLGILMRMRRTRGHAALITP